MIRAIALALFLLASFANAETCPAPQVMVGVTPICGTAVGAPTNPPTCIPPKVPQGGACVDPPVNPPVCTLPAVLEGGACVCKPPNVGAGNSCASPGSPPTGCAGFANVVHLEIDRNNPQRVYTASQGGFGPKDVVVVHFKTGTKPTLDNNLGRISCSEYGTGISARIAVLSKTACDFGPQPWPMAGSAGSTVTIPFTVINQNNWGIYPVLDANTDYYVNLKNTEHGSCVDNNLPCDMACDLLYPFAAQGAAVAGAVASKSVVTPKNAALEAAIAKMKRNQATQADMTLIQNAGQPPMPKPVAPKANK